MDFSKAFDKVPHERLLSKLHSFGVRGKLLNWIRAFLTNRFMRVKVNEAISQPATVTSGVPQGSVLGPELFKIYISDLPQTLTCACLLYADDLKLWAEVSTMDSVDLVQSYLDSLSKWSQDWMLPINYEKCKVLSVGGRDPIGVYHINGHLLPAVNSEKDLGVIISSDFKTDLDSSKRVTSANRLWWAIRRSFSIWSPKLFNVLSTAYIRPILEYGQPAVYPLTVQEVNALENVQRRGSRAIRGYRGMTYPERLVASNLHSLEYRRNRCDLIYTRRIVRGEIGGEIQSSFRVCVNNLTRGHQWKLYKQR